MLHRSPFQFFFLIGIVFVLCVGHASRSAYADTIEVRIDGYRIQPDESGRYSVVEGTPLDVYFITSDSPRKPQFYQLGDMEGEGGPDEFTYQYHIAITAPYLPGQTLPLTAYDPDTET
ncbi:MAG TPA: hypothetical protein PKL83_04045, partial [bacterium]|nr:hypothetical protein [bacterium]